MLPNTFLCFYFFSHSHSNIVQIQSIGKTSKTARELWIIRITDRANETEPGEPKVKLTANIHGNERVGGELLLYLIIHLTENYGKDERITRLVDSTDIYIVPFVNPDGTEVALEGQCSSNVGHHNGNDVDLDSDFPSQYESGDVAAGRKRKSFVEDTEREGGGAEPRRLGGDAGVEGRQSETEALMTWIRMNKFVLSASIHGGNVRVVYPYDDSWNHTRGMKSVTPDDAMFQRLAHAYAGKHPQISDPTFKCANKQAVGVDGIVNGNEWFPLTGNVTSIFFLNFC